MADKCNMLRAALFLLALMLTPCSSASAERGITVFAAASLGGLLEEIAQNSPDQVTFSYGGSGTMARQVAAGAPADVVILASSDWMDWLAQQGVPGAARGFVIAQNALVVITPAQSAQDLEITALPQRLGKGRLAMGHHRAVPAGVYTQQWLSAAGIWADLQGRLAETDNVRAALALVARGEAPFGVVYATDAQADPRVEVVYKVPPPLHAPITYLAAPLTQAGETFATILASPSAQTTFLSRGYLPPTQAVPRDN